MRDIAVARNFVGRVDDDHALVEIVGEHASDLAQQRCLADARPAEQEDLCPPSTRSWTIVEASRRWRARSCR